MKRIFLFCALFLGIITSLFGSTVEEGLKRLSLHEKICMRKFFDFAIKMDHLAHVLCFENKPVCFTGVVVKDSHRSFRDILCLKGWMYFNKNEHLFPHPKFLISEELTEGDDFKILDIYIINKKALKRCLKEHSPIFIDVIGKEFSPEWFIENLEKGRSLPSLINHSDLLLGILLGYGEESSAAFQEARETAQIPEWTDTYCGIEAKQPKGCKIFPIGFMGNPNSPEVRKTLSSYDVELEEIWQLYQQYKDPLKMSLKKLCEN